MKHNFGGLVRHMLFTVPIKAFVFPRHFSITLEYYRKELCLVNCHLLNSVALYLRFWKYILCKDGLKEAVSKRMLTLVPLGALEIDVCLNVNCAFFYSFFYREG